MDFIELEEFITNMDVKLKERRESLNQSEIEGIYARSLKVSEELWELNAEILCYFWDQRKDKVESFSKEKLEWEFADVIITTLLLAKSFDVDVKVSLAKKIQKIKWRWGMND